MPPFDLALRAGATLDHYRLQNCADGRERLRHAGRARRRARRLSPAHRDARRPRLALHAVHQARGPRARAASCTAASIANGTQTHDMLRRDRARAPRHARRAKLFRGIATDRGKLGFNGKMIVRERAHGADSDQSLQGLLTGTGAEVDVRPQLEIYTDDVRAQPRRHHRQARRADAVLPAVARHRAATRRRRCCKWAFIEDAVSRDRAAAAARARSNSTWPAQLHEVSALEGVAGRSRERRTALPPCPPTTSSACGATSPSSRARCTAIRWCSSTARPPRSARAR